MNPDLASARADLKQRFRADGGCSIRPDDTASRPDATAWACLALAQDKIADPRVQGARDFLAAGQAEDGRISMLAEAADVFWPTALAILAWSGSAAHGPARQRAVQFLLAVTGRHYPRRQAAPAAHDTELRGWPWVGGTHSWVEPTAMAMMALTLCGQAEHERVHEAGRMLLNRQLPDGGWNYGNTAVYGTVLHPLPQCTGVALAALAGRVARPIVQKSIAYLQGQAARLRTPLSLAWVLLGLGAWGQRPAGASAWLGESLGRQDRYGAYDTEALSLLCLASSATADWLVNDPAH